MLEKPRDQPEMPVDVLPESGEKAAARRKVGCGPGRWLEAVVVALRV